MTALSRARFTEAVRAEPPDLGLACALVGAEVEPQLDVDGPLAELDALAAAARPIVPAGAPPVAVAEGLRRALGELAGFAGSDADYADLRSSLLHEVLRRRRGLPLLLSVVWVEVAARIGACAWPVALPGHVVVGIGDPDDEPVYVDPFRGGRRLDQRELAALVLQATGRPLHPDDLRPAAAGELVLRLLTNVRALAARSDRALEAARTRLWAVELSLLLPRHPLELRREYGELRVRLGDFPGGAGELEDYARVVEGSEPAAAEVARREARLARARLN